MNLQVSSSETEFWTFTVYRGIFFKMLFVVKTYMHKCVIMSVYFDLKKNSKNSLIKISHLNIDLKRVFISSSVSCHIVAHRYINGIILTGQSFLACKKCMYNNSNCWMESQFKIFMFYLLSFFVSNRDYSSFVGYCFRKVNVFVYSVSSV